jgi:hypothetical protein
LIFTNYNNGCDFVNASTEGIMVKEQKGKMAGKLTVKLRTKRENARN